MFPIDIMITAGWIATSANYLWTTAMGMYSILPIIKKWQGKKITKNTYILASAATIYACNEEQVSALLLGLSVCVLVYSLVKKRRKVDYYVILIMVVSLGMMLFSLTWKGNSIRKISEISSWVPIFYMQSPAEKILNGFLSTSQYLLLSSTAVITLMCGGLAALIYYRYNNYCVRIIGCIPLAFYFCFGLFKEIMLKIFPAFSQFFFLNITNSAIFNIDVIISVTIQLFVIFLIAYLCLIALGGGKGLILSILWLGGIATRVVMGFSPTLYASSTRTFTFLLIVIIIIYTQLLIELKKDKKEIKKFIPLHLIFFIYTMYLI